MVGLLVFCFGRLFLEIFKGVLLLNVYLVIPLLTSCVNGYDSSIINGGAATIPDFSDAF